MACSREGSSIRSLLKAPRIVIEASFEMDKYTAGIDLSNACRQFYVARVKAAGEVKGHSGLSNGVSTEHECTGNVDDETKHTHAADRKVLPGQMMHNSKSAELQKSGDRSRIESAMTLLRHEMVRYFISVCHFLNSKYIFTPAFWCLSRNFFCACVVK